jgi:hypothetical protein
VSADWATVTTKVAGQELRDIKASFIAQVSVTVSFASALHDRHFPSLLLKSAGAAAGRTALSGMNLMAGILGSGVG